MVSKLFGWLPGLSTIKTWLAGLSVLSIAVLTALWKMSQAGRIKDKITGIKNARKTESRTNEAMIEGLQNEKEKLGAIDINRGDFH